MEFGISESSQVAVGCVSASKYIDSVFLHLVSLFNKIFLSREGIEIAKLEF